MVFTTCLVVNVCSVSGCTNNIGYQSGLVDPARLPCYGRLLINLAYMSYFVNTTTTTINCRC